MPTVLITGANRGLGLEFARQYAAEGWRVHAVCRDPGAAADLRAVAGEIRVHALDVADFAAIDAFAARLGSEPLDVLLLNAGQTHRPSGLGQVDYQRWADIMRVNTMAPVRMVERLVENVAAGAQKKIVAITSRLGSIHYTDRREESFKNRGGYFPYRTSKAALNMAMKIVAAELEPRGIVAVAVCPGWVRTDMGGPQAVLTPPQSIAMVRGFIARLAPGDSGGFFSHEGQRYPW
ncbi:MAG: SDR family oxidoreductase [Alphaproteobacteria bacterium]|nr:SDR family oxidoreductase [Alphaproteobacteria bacterium]